jgi:hypothetical protein
MAEYSGGERIVRKSLGSLREIVGRFRSLQAIQSWEIPRRRSQITDEI